MNKDVAKKWVDALRSGKYRQIEGFLADKEDGRCCLGVLCDLAVEEEITSAPEPLEEDSHLVYSGHVSLPPYAVTEWAGLKAQDPVLDPHLHHMFSGSEVSASRMNDGFTDASDGEFKSMNFNQIADAIEANVDKI